MKVKDIVRSLRYAVAVLLTACLGSGCGDAVDYSYEVPMEVTFDIPQGQINQFTELTVTVDNVPTDYTPYLEANATPATAVTSVQAGRCLLSSSFGNVDMGFLNDISVRARSIADPSQVEEIFYLTDFRFNEGPTVQLIGSGREVQSIMSETLVDIDVVMTFQANPSVGNVALDLEFSYLVFD